MTAILNQIKLEAKEKALHKGAYSGFKLVAELQQITNRTKPVIVKLKIPNYDDTYEVTDYTFELVSSSFTCDSWRGSYNLPSVNYFPFEQKTYSVQTVIDNILESDGEEVTGWKGGEFTLSMNDIIYIANQGETNYSTAVVSITETEDYVILETEPGMY